MRDRIAHFEILEKLGEGGMGVVYLARDEQLRRLVALKVLPRSVSSDPERRRKLLREARAAAAVSHPNLAAIYQAGEDADDVYVAMELVDGHTVRRELASGPLSIERALKIARPVLHALSRAHRHGIIHRDLKPDNVMVGEEGLVKVLDFGVAALADPSNAAATATTEEGRIVGTPGYMAPEQAMGKTADSRADIFAFGVLLTEMLTAKLPFRGATPMERLVASTRDPCALPSSLEPSVPGWIDRIVARCLEKDPNARYDSCADIVADLDRAGVALATTVESIDMPIAGLPRAPRRRTALYAGVFALLVGALLWLSFRRRPTPVVLVPAPTSSPAAPTTPTPVQATTPIATPVMAVPSPSIVATVKSIPKKPIASTTVAPPPLGPLDDQK